MIDHVIPPDLHVLQVARLQAEVAAARAELAAAQLEVLQLRTFVRYGLNEADRFDIKTGQITRAAADPEVPSAADPEMEWCMKPEVANG